MKVQITKYKVQSDMEMKLLFEQPCYEMSPNGRLHWGKKARLVSKVRTSSKLLTLCVVRNYPEFEGFVPNVYDIVWYYSRGPEPDEDNVVARLKPILDGCADALRVNDRGWHLGALERVKVKAADPLSGKVEIVLRYELRDTKDEL